MASKLRQLEEADLEQLHKMLRQDAKPDAEIAAWAEKKLGKKLGPTAHAGEAVVSRYRASTHFKGWLRKEEERESGLRKALSEQHERYEMISRLLKEKGEDTDAFGTLSRSIQARLLTLAAEATDDDLVQATSGRGWIKNLLTVVRESEAAMLRQKVAALKGEIEAAGKKKGGLTNTADLVAKVDEIMGIRKTET